MLADTCMQTGCLLCHSLRMRTVMQELVLLCALRLKGVGALNCKLECGELSL